MGFAPLAVLLYLVLVDAAIETMVSGSPLRWIVAGAVAGCMALSALLWRRLSWVTKASVSGTVLLGLIAFAAWQPTGSDSAITLLRQPTSTLLSVATVVGIVLAGWVLARLKFLPWQSRVAFILLAAYGMAAFVVGIATRTSYATLLHGGSLWDKVPVWLQGAFIGAAIIIPAALLLQLVNGASQIRAGHLHAWSRQVLALSLCGAITVSGFRMTSAFAVAPVPEPAAAVAALTPEEKQLAYKDEVAALESRLTRLQSYLDGFPKALTEVAALAETLPTPEKAFEFVRDQVALEPYPGVMKGARVTLLTRGGNSLDRALLLAAILNHNSVSARIAHGKLSPDQAQNLLLQIAAEPGSVEHILQSLPNHAPSPTVTDHQREFGELREQRGEQAGSALRDAVDKNLPLIESALKKNGLPGETAAAQRRLEILQDHYWVQATLDGQNVDFDPSLKTANLNQKLTDATETFDPNDLADSLFQQVRFRLVGEFLEDGRLQSQELLSKEVKATDLFGKNLRLAVAPSTPKTDEVKFQALLLVGDDRTDGKEFSLRSQSGGGESNPSEGTGGPDTGAAKPAGGMLGALGGEEAEAPAARPEVKTTPSASGPVLARLFWEISSAGPHLAEAVYQRIILDRLEASGSKQQIQPALADDKVVRALLVQVWDGAISVGSNHPLHVLATRLDALKARESMEEKARARLYLGASFGVDDLPGPTLPAELIDYFFSADLARFVLGRQHAPKARWYYERPRLAFFRHGFVVGDWSRPQDAHRFAEGIDLLNTPFQFLGDREGARRLGMESGISDTALERLTVDPDRSFNTIPLFAAAEAESIPTLTIGPEQKRALEDVPIPAAIKNVLAGELAQGHTLILPARLVKLGDTRTYGWWSVDPATGMALGKMELGGAQAMTETIEMNERVEKWTEIFAKFYGSLLTCYMKALGENLGGMETPKTGHVHHGAPGEDPMPDSDKLAGCVIGAACKAIADLLAEATTSAAFAREATQEIKSLKHIIMEWAAEFAHEKGMEKGLEKMCEQMAGAKE